MTDDTTETTEQPRTLKVVTCINRRHPTRSCHALIEDDRDTRIAHRQWHLDQETDREALRGAVKSRDETIALLRQEIAGYSRDVEAYGREVAGFHGEVQRVETPTAPPALQINRDGYDDDELEDEPDEPAPYTDDADLPVTREFLDALPPQPTAAQEAEYDDEDDDPHTIERDATSSPVWAR